MTFVIAQSWSKQKRATYILELDEKFGCQLGARFGSEIAILRDFRGHSLQS